MCAANIGEPLRLKSSCGFSTKRVGRRNSLKIEAKERVVGSAWSFWRRALASHDGIVHFEGEAIASGVNE
jgi:hypothetical protein